MSKENTINFFEGYRSKETKRNKWIGIIISIIFIICSLKIVLGISTIKNLQSYIENNNKNKETIAIKQKNSISLNQIREIYQVLGPSNINKFLVNNLSVEVEGICENLSVLENMKNIEGAKNLTINGVRKEGTSYVFNLKYSVGDNIENE